MLFSSRENLLKFKILSCLFIFYFSIFDPNFCCHNFEKDKKNGHVKTKTKKKTKVLLCVYYINLHYGKKKNKEN